jgi:plasmid maintenance system antidote protein VapI
MKGVIDLGNSSFKSIIEGTEYLKVPNIVSYLKPDYRIENQYSKSKVIGKNRLDLTITTKQGTKEEKETSILLGTMAEQKDANVETRKPSLKSKDDQLLALAMGDLAFSAINYLVKRKKKISRKMTIRMAVSTGLPYDEWKDEKNNIRFEEKFKGNHLVRFNSPYFKNEIGIEEVTLVIDKVISNAEGLSTLNCIMYDENRDIAKKEPYELVDKIITSFNIGAGTSEGVTVRFVRTSEEDEELEVEAQIVDELSKGFPIGIGTIMDEAIPEIQSAFNTDKLTRRDIEKAFQNKVKPCCLVGTDNDISDIFNKYAKSFAYKISREWIGLYNKFNVKLKVIKIYINGGGSYFPTLVDYIKDNFEEDGLKREIIEVVTKPDPVFSDAIGYHTELIDYLTEMDEMDEIAVEQD